MDRGRLTREAQAGWTGGVWTGTILQLESRMDWGRFNLQFDLTCSRILYDWENSHFFLPILYGPGEIHLGHGLGEIEL